MEALGHIFQYCEKAVFFWHESLLFQYSTQHSSLCIDQELNSAFFYFKFSLLKSLLHKGMFAMLSVRVFFKTVWSRRLTEGFSS